jgi:hypothetical protein
MGGNFWWVQYFGWKFSEEGRALEMLGMDERVILKWILDKYIDSGSCGQ